MKYFKSKLGILYNDDSLKLLKNFPDNSISTIICDPPYGLEFMGKEWDKFKNGHNIAGGDTGRNTPYARSKPTPAFYQLTVEQKNGYQQWVEQWARELLRVAKPGATLLAFGGTRTFHRLACGLEDAGWIIKDTLMWLYGSGFPKSLSFAFHIEKQLTGKSFEQIRKDSFTTPEAKEWATNGTALKPAYEPIIMAIKPNGGSYADNALKWGVAGLNIDAGRIKYISEEDRNVGGRNKSTLSNKTMYGRQSYLESKTKAEHSPANNKGRFPANILLDEEAAKMLGKPSRFFYVAKASKRERNMGLEGFGKKIENDGRDKSLASGNMP